MDAAAVAGAAVAAAVVAAVAAVAAAVAVADANIHSINKSLSFYNWGFVIYSCLKASTGFNEAALYAG